MNDGILAIILVVIGIIFVFTILNKFFGASKKMNSHNFKKIIKEKSKRPKYTLLAHQNEIVLMEEKIKKFQDALDKRK